MKNLRPSIQLRGRILWILCVFALAVAAYGQKGGGAAASSTTSSSGSSGGGAGGGGVAIEAQMIAYEAISNLATEIAARIRTSCTDTGTDTVLLVAPNATPNNLTGIAAFEAFQAAAMALRQGYCEMAGGCVGEVRFSSGTVPLPTDWVSAIGGILTNARTQTTQSSAAFTPIDQALYSDLERELESSCPDSPKTTCTKETPDSSDCRSCTKATRMPNHCMLVTTAYPGGLEDAYTDGILPSLTKIYTARQQAVGSLTANTAAKFAAAKEAAAKEAAAKEAAAKDAAAKEAAAKEAAAKEAAAKEAAAEETIAKEAAVNDARLQKLDAALASLIASIADASASSGVPNVLLGAALLEQLGDEYHVLTVADVGAGGGTRQNVYFFINLFIPAPHPAYNGGAIVAYTLRNQDGKYESADTISLVFGYTKWGAPQQRNQNTKGYTNFNWDDSNNKGPWKPHY